ncbi:lipopolysaccharide-assembly, LptC-related [bacterium BMS3Abin07]|nr:lipopolysaccharide-assembly, LptC-related [bacterium BMS3Abin07]GBE32071.1 lipopolysaccharide-assembly, LptC-related [bacterium BMS3Bbin05]HDO22661.1 LPS export ABC transporter periplasmic protein LptC [Nitrospirota bacterium]
MIKIISFFTALFLLSAILFNYRKSSVPTLAINDDSFMEKVSVLHVTSGVIDWKADIDKVFIDSGSRSSIIRDVSFTFPGRNVTASADNGIFDMDRDNLFLYHNVKAKKNSMDITAESISWNNNKKSLSSDSRIIISEDLLKLSGKGLDISNDGRITIKKNVRAILY